MGGGQVWAEQEEAWSSGVAVELEVDRPVKGSVSDG